MLLFLLAVLAGALTVLAPCILPILPVILASGSESKHRPWFVVLGFILSFSLIGGLIATAGSLFGFQQGTLRYIAIILLLFFGLMLIFEPVYSRLTSAASVKLNMLSSRIQLRSTEAKEKSPVLSGLLVGIALGVVWTPCAGPILGTVLTLAATQPHFGSTAVLLAAYSFGAAIPMLIIAKIGNKLHGTLTKYGKTAKLANKIFGLLVIFIALAMFFGFDVDLQVYLLDFYPEGIVPL